MTLSLQHRSHSNFLVEIVNGVLEILLMSINNASNNKSLSIRKFPVRQASLYIEDKKDYLEMSVITNSPDALLKLKLTCVYYSVKKYDMTKPQGGKRYEGPSSHGFATYQIHKFACPLACSTKKKK